MGRASQTKDNQIWVRLSPDLKKWVQQQARKDGRSMSNWIAHKIRQLQETAK